jgi:hypothetical protein
METAPSGNMSVITSFSAQNLQATTSKTTGSKKTVENLPVLRNTLSAINDNYLNVQQDILETFVDRGQLRKLAEPTITSAGKRIQGLMRRYRPCTLLASHSLSNREFHR